MIIKYQETLITDSGDIYDTTIGGGRVGLFTFQQDFGIWSNLRVQCAETVNRALKFDGMGDYIQVDSVAEPQVDVLERSVTVSVSQALTSLFCSYYTFLNWFLVI